jgi:asparagine synthetase B (glutamine-hydrolysing)
VPGAVVAFGAGIPASGLNDLLSSIDLLDHGVSEHVAEPSSGMVGVNYLASRPRERVVYNRGDAFICCAGNVPGTTLPWEDVLNDLRAGTSSALTELCGRFALIGWDRTARKIHLVTDQISQQPLFYYHRQRRFVASTALASFYRALPELDFEPKWLYESFFFNFPISFVAPLRNVFRVPPASVVTFDLNQGSQCSRRYAARLGVPETILGPDLAAERAIEVFRERIPVYVEGASRPAVGITSGFDSRTILALIADQPSLLAFTYGVPGCEDVIAGAQIAHALGLPFRHLPFDAEFEKRLPDLMRSTVYLSSGMQGVNRATLLDAISNSRI